MASEIPREIVYGNFKPKRIERIKAKKSPADKRKKLPGNSDEHLKLLRTLPCCIPGCPNTANTVHHLKTSGERGAALRSPDKYGLPICWNPHHEDVERAGSKNELKWFSDRGIEALELAAALWAVSPNPQAMYRVLMAHKNSLRDEK